MTSSLSIVTSLQALYHEFNDVGKDGEDNEDSKVDDISVGLGGEWSHLGYCLGFFGF